MPSLILWIVSHLQVLLRQSFIATVWVYGVVCIVSALLSLQLPIETMGRELMVRIFFLTV